MCTLSRFVIIADDLTGANDTGVQFAKQNFTTISLLDLTYQHLNQDTEVLVYNAETRSLAPEAAYESMRKAAKQLPLAQASCVYKKIDSTMRGNIGAEIDAIMDVHSFDLAVVIPAYPKGARMTIGGYHLVQQTLLEDSEFSKDPKCPVTESFLPSLLSAQTRRKLGHVGIQQIRDPFKLRQEIEEMLNAGVQLIIFDAAVQQDMERVVKALSDDLRCLWVGSAGLAQSLADQWVDRTSRVKQPDPWCIPDEQPLFVISGSVSSVSKQQVEQLARKKEEFSIVKADPIGLLDNSTQEWNCLVEQILNLVDQGKNPILTTDSSIETRKAVEDWRLSKGIGTLDIGNKIADQLGELGSYVISQRKFSGIIATGGDIAYRLCCHTEVKALQVLDEVEAGIPLSRILGGPADGLPIVTKAGGFGHPDSFINAVNKLKIKQTTL